MRFTDTDEFLDIVNNEDELLMVMRLHQLMDGLISDLIAEKLIEKHHLELRRIPCAVRIEFAQAMGLLQPGDRGAILQFNALRNRFAHESQATITQKDAQDLHNALGERLRALADANEEQLSTPVSCLRHIAAVITIALDSTLEHVRDLKLWDVAVMQEVKAVLAKRPRQTTGKAEDRIRARFEVLKTSGA